jgi:hypothetical protein
MLAVVEDKDLRRDRLRGYEERILQHVPRTVHLPLVVDLLNNLLECRTPFWV